MPGFTGVPVFQAEGLTVKTETTRYTPIFLCKSDLDAAVHHAYSQRVTQKVQLTQAKVDRAHHELDDASKQVLTPYASFEQHGDVYCMPLCACASIHTAVQVAYGHDPKCC